MNTSFRFIQVPKYWAMTPCSDSLMTETPNNHWYVRI